MTANVKKVQPKGLRDELAIEAMRVLMTEIRTHTEEGPTLVAVTAYKIADEMMKAREAKPA